MALRAIVQDDDFLHKKCRPVENFDERLHVLLDDMAETLHVAEGVGLAAPQVGVLRRVCIVDIGDEKGVMELINPRILCKKGTQQEAEGCLSYPGVWGYTKRPAWVKVEAQDRNGKTFTLEGEGLLARAFCHEIDHLDGVTFQSHVTAYCEG